MKRWSLHSWTLVASSGKLDMDRRKWHFSKNQLLSGGNIGKVQLPCQLLFEENKSAFSQYFRFISRTTQKRLKFIWLGSYRELGASQLFESCLKLRLANYTQCIFLTPCNTHMWYSCNSSLMSVQLPVAMAIVQTAASCLSSSLVEGFFILMAEHGEK